MAENKRARFIYRIERECGTGPYQGPWRDGDAWDFDGRRHPTPSRDEELGFWGKSRPHEWRFGFRSVEQMRFWFHTHGMRSSLRARGFLLAKYWVPRGCSSVSDAQAIFHSPSARLISRTAIPA